MLSKSVELSVKINPVWAEYVSDILIEKIGCSGVVTDEKQYKDEILIKDNAGIIKGYLPFVENLHLNQLCHCERPMGAWQSKEKQTNIFCIASSTAQLPDKYTFHESSTELHALASPRNDSCILVETIQKILLEEKQKLITSGVKEEDLGDWSVSSTEISDEEWAHSWKQYWHPQKISEKIVICPSWENYKAENNEIIINLDPGSAFGTGTHPTTRLCVQAMEKIITRHCEENSKSSTRQSKENIDNQDWIASSQAPRNDKYLKIADIGTGSGILAIAGIKLEADFAVGVDNDASVINVAVENAIKNDIADKCRFYTGTAADIKDEFDLVIANILAEVIIENMPELVKLVKTGGKLILSGIISAKSDSVENSAIEHGLKITEILKEENWVAIIAEK